MMIKSKVKYIQSLSHKKQRDADKVFVAEGPKIINELLNEIRLTPVELYALPGWINADAKNKNLPVSEIDEITLSRISSLSAPNEVLGIFHMPRWPVLDLKNNVTLLLNTIQDPGNLGTILRCADWFGIRQIVCSNDCADVYGSKVIQATMGSVGRVQVYYEDLSAVITDNPTVPLYAATLNGADVHTIRGLEEGMILIGNESRGIAADLLRFPHHKITIARKGSAESLNAAVAAGIILHVVAG